MPGSSDCSLSRPTLARLFPIPKGNIETRHNSPNAKSRNVELRLRLGLFVNVIHCKSFPGVHTRHQGIDIVLIRQNTEGEYSCAEHEVG